MYEKGIVIVMKKVIIYGNCQIEYIENYLKASLGFSKKYEIVLSKPIFAVSEKDVGIEKLADCDVFIYQNINGEFKHELKTENIKKLLKKECICINIPVAYFTAYFPQYAHNPVNKSSEKYVWGKYPYGDSNIIEFMESPLSNKKEEREQFLKKVESRDFYNEEFLKTNIKNSLEELRKRECNCDFNISDLIEASYDKEYLFFTVNHPSFKIIRYMSVQILKILGIDTYDIEDLVIEKLDHIMIPIYPSVASGLELKFIDDGQLYNYIDGKISFGHYMKDYIEFCYGLSE